MTWSDQMDLGFVRELSSLGGESVGICISCGTCTATCPLSSARKGFPRRTIRHVQLGLREKAIHDVDMWLCASCRTCNASCPRGASPGEVMSALARYSSTRYSPGGIGRWLLHPGAKAYATLLGLAALFVSMIALVAAVPAGGVSLQGFIPFSYVDYLGAAIGVTVAAGLAMNFRSMWRNTRTEAAVSMRLGEFPGLLLKGAKTMFNEVILQRGLRQCESNLYGASSHLMVVLGLIGAGFTTFVIFVTNPTSGPPPLADPVKIVGNVSAALLLTGTSMMLARRFTKKGREFRYYFYDWLFLGLIFTAALTGVLTEGFRLAGIALPTYGVYSVHLVIVALLLLTAPYTKFAHSLYRLMASWVGDVKGWKEKGGEVLEA